jgi:hypothetical protein
MGVMAGLDRIHIVIANNCKFHKAAAKPAFFECADTKLANWLLRHFGWSTIPNELRISSVLRQFEQGWAQGSVTTWQSDIFIGRNIHPCKICYRTLSGALYMPHLMPNCQDLEFWIEDLNSKEVLNSLKNHNQDE